MGERRLLLATTNQHKIEEFRAILSGVPCRLVNPRDLGLDVRIQEIGSTFAENAVLKAIAYAEASGLPVLADDSGLEIDALNGEPGIFSSRWAGEDVSYPERFHMLFNRLTDVPEPSRTARYRCAIAIARPAPYGLYNIAEGILEGKIALAPAGDQGFGYDPIFLVPDLNQTVAQITAEEKHRISHRGRAATAAAAMIAHWFDNGDDSTCP